VALTARDAATLLVDWLNELIGRSEVEGRAYAEVRGLTIADARGPSGNETRLAAQVRGRRVTAWTSALKAATYHGLELQRSPAGWRARVLFDV
jgi:SHS2 domain-containing protein